MIVDQDGEEFSSFKIIFFNEILLFCINEIKEANNMKDL